MRRLHEVLEHRSDNYVLPFLWLHGEDEALLRESIAKIQEAGIHAVCVESRPHPDFVGPLWWRDLDIIMDEARSRGMKVWVLDDSHFPTGYANGKVEAEHPELVKKYLKIHQLDFVGPMQDASFLVKWGSPGNRMSLTERPEPVADRILSIIAAKRTGDQEIDPTTLTDVTHLERGGVLYWDLPEGDWRIFVLLQSIHGGEPHTAGYLNPLDPAAVQVLIDEVYESHYARYQDDFGATFAGFFSDEPRFGNAHGAFHSIGRSEMVLPWKEGLEHEFTEEERLRLPLLSTVSGDGEEHGIRYRYMDMVSRMYGEAFTGTLGAWCREHGVEYIGHLIEDNNAHARLGYGAGHFYRALWEQDMSGIDVVLNQIMPGMDKGPFKSMTGAGWDGEFFHYGLAKLGTSLGHLDPKKQNRTMCEVYGAYGWSEGIKLMKWITDHMLVRGVTHFVPHAFSPKSFPDPDCPPHLDARGHNPQYRVMSVLFDYLNRTSHLLNGGVHIADIGLLYHAEAEWLGDYMLFQKPARELTQHQLDFDVVPGDLVIDSVLTSDAHGRAVYTVNGKPFGVLVIPYAEALPKRLMEKVRKLAEAGVAVLFVDGLPVRDEQGRDATEILGAANLNATAESNVQSAGANSNLSIVALDELASALRSSSQASPGIDVTASEFQPYLRAYRYSQPDGEVYMFFNEDPYRTIETEVTLGIDVTVAEYDAFANELRGIAQRSKNGKTAVTLKLAPYQSAVLVQTQAGQEFQAAAEPTQVLAGVSATWELSFATSVQYPIFGGELKLEKLTDLSRIQGYERFSGTVRYKVVFTLNELPTEPVAIDLGRVFEVAEPMLNGIPLGVKICPPYVFGVKQALRIGENELIVDVTNNLGKQEQDYLSQYMAQEPTGLLGPVRVLV